MERKGRIKILFRILLLAQYILIKGKVTQSVSPFFLLSFLCLGTDAVSWEDWWTYDGISGPSFWGLINPEWSLCNAGKMQSPVNVDPKGLLYDHTLANINFGSDKTNGHVFNTGHGVSFLLDLGINDMVNISGGPLSYNYPIYDVSLHFGLRDDQGSEHTIDGEHFAGELQLLGYNADLYDNYTTASRHPNGLVGVAVLIQVGTYSNSELRKITDAAMSVQYRGMKSETIHHNSLFQIKNNIFRR